METSDIKTERHVTSPPKLNPKNDKPVPITLKLTLNWKEIVEKIDTITTANVEKRIFKDSIKFFPRSVDDYRALQNILSVSKLEYFSLPLKLERPPQNCDKRNPSDSD